MVLFKDHKFSGVGRLILTVIALACFTLSLLPLVWAVGRPWPGFFYSPFYTSNIFSDATTPAYQVGLRPEDRVVQAGALPGHWPRINFLASETALAAQSNRSLTLVYELGREATTIALAVESLNWLRLAEKAGPIFLAGVGLTWLSFSKANQGLFWQGFTGLSALALLAGADYFLNPGSGLESGFAPGEAADWLAASGKWSAYLYMPLWKLAVAAGLIYAFYFLFAKNVRLQRASLALTLALLVFDLTSYSYEAIRTATFNNPDYIVWYSRAAFWPEWISLSLWLTLVAVRSRNWRQYLSLAGFLLFVIGFIVPTTFDLALPGPGPQWYSLGIVLSYAPRQT